MKGDFYRQPPADGRFNEDLEQILMGIEIQIKNIQEKEKNVFPTPILRPKSTVLDGKLQVHLFEESRLEVENLKQEAIRKTELLLENLPEKQRTEFQEAIYERLYPGQKAPEKPQPHFAEKTTVIDFTAAAQVREEQTPQETKGRFSRFLKDRYQQKEPDSHAKEKDDREPEL